MVESCTRSRVFAIPLIVAAAAAVFGSVSKAEDVTAVDPEALLERTRQFYAGTDAFHETLELELVMPDGSRSSRKQDYGIDSQGGAFFRLASDGGVGLRIVAKEGRIVADWTHLPERYAEAAYNGDFAAGLEALEAPQVQLWAPPAIVAAQGGDRQAFLDALRFGILAPVEPHSVKEATDDTVLEVELVAANGSLALGVDRDTGRLRSGHFVLGEGESQVQASGTFSFVVGEPRTELEWPNLTGRASVPTLTALEASEYPIGESAPALAITTLDGKVVELESLIGNVVVLDFWATWCVPCWTALEHTEALSEWARGSGLPVAIFAVDTLERVDSLEAQTRQASRFLGSKGLDLEVLIDYGNSAFAAFHNPGLPSLVIVDPQGRLAEYHSGVLEDMTETVKASVQTLLGASN